MATASSPAIRWRNDRLFYTGMALFAALCVFTGFSRSYYLSRWLDPPAGTPEITTLLHVHGALFTLWMLLTVAQPALIASGNRRLHRTLGYAGAGIAVLMVVLGHLVAKAAMSHGFAGLGDPHAFYAIPFFAINSFAVIVALAVLWRNRAETHKRLMLLSSVPLIEAAVARFPVAAIGEWMPVSFILGSDAIILAGVLYDLASRGRVHKVWIWGGGAVIAVQFLRLILSQTEPWLDFARVVAAL